MSQVFLCYSSRDECAAAEFRDELCRHGLKVWWDAELPRAKNWATELGRALEKSDSMIVLVSPNSMNSDLVLRELRHAICHENFEHRLFPVILEQTSVMPWFFKMLPVFDITKNRSRGITGLVRAIKTHRTAARSSA